MSKLISLAGMLMLLGLFLTQGSQASSEECRDATAPSTKPRGVNQVGRSPQNPLFQLQVTPTDRDKTYGVSLVVDKTSDVKVSEVVLSVTSNGSCGHGEFDFSLDDFVEVIQEQGGNCPRLIQTKRRTRDMKELHPLIWTPPSCGCVLFRILLVTSGRNPVYYAENEAVTSGPLAKSVCIFKQALTAKISRERRLESLCHVLDKRSSGEIMSRDHFVRHRGLDSRWMDHYGMEMALELRRADVKDCCMKKLTNQRMDCFDDVRRRRIDDFCRDGRSDIPFRNFRRDHMRRLEKSCCFLLGELRYQCFAKDSEMTSHKAAGGTSSLDFSMDASDVVNDLADFGSQQHLDEHLRPKNIAKLLPSNPTFDNEEGEEEEKEEDDEEEAESESEEIDEKEYSPFLIRKDDENNNNNIDDDDDENDEGNAPSELSAGSKYRRPIIQRKPSRSRDAGTIIKRKDKMTPTMTQLSTHPLRKTQPIRSNMGSRNVKKLWRMARKQIKRKNIFNQSVDKIRKSKGERKHNKHKNKKAHRRDRNSAKNNTKLSKRLRKFHENELLRKAKQERKIIATKTMKKGNNQDLRKVTDRKELSPLTPGDDILKSIGGDSSDRTLRRLQRKMRRLRLLNDCCSGGSSSGSRVYGGLEQVTAECRHSAGKFVAGQSMRGKTARKCRTQFEQCCREAAKTGLTMSSHEFPEAFSLDDQDYIGIPTQMDDRLRRLRQQVPTIYQSLGELRKVGKSENPADNEPNEVLQIWDLVAKVQQDLERRPPASSHGKRGHWNAKTDREYYYKPTSSPKTDLSTTKKFVQPGKVTGSSSFELKREQERRKAMEAIRHLELSKKGENERNSRPGQSKERNPSDVTSSLKQKTDTAEDKVQHLDSTTAKTITESPKLESVGRNSKLDARKNNMKPEDTHNNNNRTSISSEVKRQHDNVQDKDINTETRERKDVKKKVDREENTTKTKIGYQKNERKSTLQNKTREHKLSSSSKETDSKRENTETNVDLSLKKDSSRKQMGSKSKNIAPSHINNKEKEKSPTPTPREDSSPLGRNNKKTGAKKHHRHDTHSHKRHHKHTKSSTSTQFPHRQYKSLPGRLALDSREIAERNEKTKTVIGQLDSREMAEKYNKESHHQRLASLRPRSNISRHRRYHRRRSMWF